MQLRTSPTIKFFHKSFKNKLGFEEYASIDKPTVFFGVYRDKDVKAVLNHKGVRIIWLAGSDAIIDNILSSLKNIKDDNTVFIAESDWIKKDFERHGIEYESISFCMDDLYAWRSVPLGPSLYWYSANNSKYGKEHFSAVRKAFPDLDIITNESTTVPRSEMPGVYTKCFAGVRPIEHDGMSQTVAEMGLMGRMSIWNMKTPFTVPYEGTEGLIEAIRRLRSDYNHNLVSKRARGFFIENERKWTDIVLRLCGPSESDIAGIFNEDDNRCGSFFRIMRSSVVDQLPDKFGTNQFERPYISEQLKLRGLRRFITSKNSGFIVSEWKSLRNKGYDPDFKDFHTYDEKYS